MARLGPELKNRICDLWLGGYTYNEFRDIVGKMNVPVPVKAEALILFQSLQMKLSLQPRMK